MRKIIVVPADLHCGSTVGLIPNGIWQKAEGGTYTPSPAQRIIWKQWLAGWKAVEKLRSEKDAKLIVTFNGDLVDGIHHDTSELVTDIREEQERIATDCIDAGLKIAGFKDGDVLQFTRGTGTHVGKGSEERIARDFDARPSKKPTQGKSDGKFLFDRCKFYANKVLFDIAHEGFGIGTRAWTTENSVLLSLKSMYWESLENGVDLPRYIIRSHLHRFIDVLFSRNGKMVNGIITPSFQLSTHYVNQRVTGKSLQLPSIGMFIVVVEDTGQSYTLCEQIILPSKRVVRL